MSETRYDWLTDRWVIFAPHRSKRPDDFVSNLVLPDPSSIGCPFCMGHELQTPSEVLVLPSISQSHGDWLVRVVPNKYPALETLGDDCPSVIEKANSHWLQRYRTSKVDSDGEEWLPMPSISESVFFDRRPLRGAHEVIVESPTHATSLTQLSETHVRLVFEAFRRRLMYWRSHEAIRYAVAFKNRGPEAGASLSHTHSQLIATDFVPPDVERACQRKTEYLEATGRTYFEDMIAGEQTAEVRVVLQTENFIAIVPFASQVPYFVVVLPLTRLPRFEDIESGMLDEFNLVVLRLLHALESLLPGVAYNFVLHTSPFDPRWEPAYHWRMELFPRLTKFAGFEWGSECFINPVLPEEAAATLARRV